MIRISASEFARRCGGACFGEAEITGFTTDSRNVQPGDLYIAAYGERADGHDFVDAAIKAGAACSLVARPVNGPHILVEDVVASIAALGLSYRAEFNGPVIGITGSAGKTSAKEFTYAALGVLGPVLKSQGNRNTEYTNPLTWVELQPSHKSVVLEMGMRGFGQILHLAQAALPTIGLVTGIGTAHIEKVGSREGICKAKGELLQVLPSDGYAVLWQEDDYLNDLKQLCECEVQTFGTSQEADCRIIGSQSLDWENSLVRLSYRGEEADVVVPAIGRHQARNAAAGVLVAVLAGADFKEAVAALKNVQLPPMRLEAREYKGATIILDNYNASPDSTVAAIRTLNEVPVKGRRLAILGEMKELGDFTESGHRLVGTAVAESSIDQALLTGGPTKFIYDEAVQRGFQASRLDSRDVLDLEIVRTFVERVAPGDVLLIKGSRALGLENALPKDF